MNSKYITKGAAERLLQQDAVGVLPTDTVYGLVCSARSQKAVTRMYELKHREKKPGTIVAANIQQLVELGVKKRYLNGAQQFWPGPISIETPMEPELSYLHQGTYRMALRIPSDQKFVEILEKVGPLLTSSANQPGEPTSETIAQAVEYFGDTIDFYLDGGDLSGRPPSTIIRIVDDAIEVVRQGAVTIDETGRISS